MNKIDKVEVLKNLVERNSLDSLLDVVPDKHLYNDQIVVTILSLLKKKLLISFDTGFGKTVVAAALMNLLTNSDTKTLFILKRTTLEEIYRKLKTMNNDNIRQGYITNQSSVIYNMIERGKIDTCNAIVISSDAISDVTVNDYLFSIRNKLKLVVVDEMHLFANLESVESRLMYYLLRKSEYSVALTATPFERDISQLINIIYCLKPELFDKTNPRTVANKFKVFENGQMTGYKNLDTLKKIIHPVVFNLARGAEGKYCVIHAVYPKDEWRNLPPLEAVPAIKGDVTAEPFQILCNILDDYIEQGYKGIVYANLEKIKRPVYEKLQELGYNVGIVDGTVSIRSEREITKQRFNSHQLDVLIINTAESADLECDFVIFYELTLKYYQFVGRSRRSRKAKNTYIHLIYAKDTYEEKYFLRNVYSRLKVLGKLCDKDISEIEEAYKLKRGESEHV